ncbi:uncharacterized protein LOC106667154 [Cimex lectularius]|uniref:Uncharacterized protein n=1 Tax=Cimex lectularius TaxID=79782 RepID=A0A8I6RRS3_CIMLE|nr:uncharacterized protein LOC106667154 [Cimex lectularius]
MTRVDKFGLFITFYYIVIITSGEWIELPKLSRQDIPSSFKKQSQERLSPNISLFRMASTMQPTILLENDEENYSYEYSNQSYTFFDPKLESVLLNAHHVLVEEAQHPIRHKLRFLKRLQNNILNQIWRRSQLLWTADNLEGRGHGHMMSFPSLESALMTISFLTFAAFLIKIVKQFLQGLQGANGNMVGVEFPGAAAPAKVVRQRRGLNYENLEVAQLLQYINQLKTNHRP